MGIFKRREKKEAESAASQAANREEYLRMKNSEEMSEEMFNSIPEAETPLKDIASDTLVEKEMEKFVQESSVEKPVEDKAGQYSEELQEFVKEQMKNDENTAQL